MKFNYDKDTDSLYINLIDVAGVDSFEIAPDFIADIDSNGRVVGIEVLNVGEKVDLQSIIFDKIPVNNVQFINQPVG